MNEKFTVVHLEAVCLVFISDPLISDTQNSIAEFHGDFPKTYSSEPEPHQVVINQQDPGGVG